jgi:predicted alpha/beta-hydrolase family hydrolase
LAYLLKKVSLVSNNQTKIFNKMKNSETAVMSYGPIVMPETNRYVDLQMKVSAPATGNNLPVLILSHGHGRSNFLSSLYGYGPMADFFSKNGFVVIQPTHQNSKSLALDASLPEAPLFWSSRPKDVTFIIDNLDEIISKVPGLTNRVNKEQLSVVGHSMGGHTVGMLAGMEVTDPVNAKKVNAVEKRLKAYVMIGAPGAPAGLVQSAKEHYPVLNGSDFTTMTQPVLVVNGDKDINPNFSEVDNWRADGYYLSPGNKSLLTVFGAEHIFGGISGYDSNETTDESPERVEFVNRCILAYLRSALDPKDTSWTDAQKELNDIPGAKGRIDNK